MRAKTLFDAYDVAPHLADTPESRRHAAYEALKHADFIPEAETLSLSEDEAVVVRLWRKAGRHAVVFDALLGALVPALWFHQDRLKAERPATPKASPTRSGARRRIGGRVGA